VKIILSECDKLPVRVMAIEKASKNKQRASLVIRIKEAIEIEKNRKTATFCYCRKNKDQIN
jgi:hypothetical protein